MHVNCYDMIETSFGQHLSHQFQGNIASSPHLGYKQKSRNNNIYLYTYLPKNKGILSRITDFKLTMAAVR